MAVLAILAIFAGEIFLSSHQESQVYDEADHLFSGYEYWKHADFGRNPEHPPLVKLVAALPLLPLSPSEPNIPYSNFKSSDFYNGAKFLYSGDADALLARGRGMLLIFALGLALAIFAATSEMFSREAGLLAMLLFALEPVVIANAGFILTDTAISCLMFLAVYTFYRFANKPGPGRLAACAVAVGLNLVTKHSGVLILPMLALVAIVDLLAAHPIEQPSIRGKYAGSPDRTGGTFSRMSKDLRKRLLSFSAIFALCCLVSYAMLWVFYGFRFSARPEGLAMSPSLQSYSAAIHSPVAAGAILFCARHHLLPEAYLYGWADILQVPGSRVAFLLGKLRLGSWRFGYPLVFFIKTTIPLLVLLLLVPFSRVWRKRQECIYLVVPAATYFLIAVGSGMSAELRYILPIYPYLFVLAGAAAWEIAQRSRPWALTIAGLILFTTFSSVHAFPSYMAYANEFFGGPSRSYRLLAGSNGDSGQGLKWVKAYLDQNHVSECWFDYVNPMVDPVYYGIPCKALPSETSQQGGIPTAPIPPVISGIVLISATERAARTWEPDSLNPYAVFDHLKPIATPGDIVMAYRGTFRVDLLAALSHSLYCRMLLNHGMTAQAVAEAQQAASLAPSSAGMQATLGLALIQAGRVQQGQQVNANALRLAYADRPEYQQALIHLLQQPNLTPPVQNSPRPPSGAMSR